MTKEKGLKTRWAELPYLYKIQLCTMFIAGICGAICSATVTKSVYSNVEVDLLTERMLLSSIIGIVLSVAWLTIQEKLFNWFKVFNICEILAYTFICIYTAITLNFSSYLIWITIISGTIGHIVEGGSSKIHQKITDNEQYRTDYGYFSEIIACAGIIIGGSIALISQPPIFLAFTLQLVAWIGFNLSDMYVYDKVKDKK